MCGIVGYIGKRKALPILVDGLKRLEYRGYDSAGVAVLDRDIEFSRAAGKISALEDELRTFNHVNGLIGIAHTRWATHGPPTKKNAHPHKDSHGKIALVHNGIIENYSELREELKTKGHVFLSDTDTEVLAHLIEQTLEDEGNGHKRTADDFLHAVRLSLKRVCGTFGIAVISSDFPDVLITARLGSPIVIGVGDDEYVIASDASALISHTKNVIYLDDNEICAISRNGYHIASLENQVVSKTIEEIEWGAEEVQKNGQPHYMMKEMFEQPEVLLNSMRGRVDKENGLAVLGGLQDVGNRLREIDRIIIVACGSAYYAGLVGEYMLEEYAGIPVEVELGSEYRYRKPVINQNTAVLAISQSGETADTLAAIREGKMKGALTLGIVNTVGSTIARETDAGVYNHAGPEIGVASTKAYISQLTILALFTLFLGRQRNMSAVTGKRIVEELQLLPEKIQSILDQREQIRDIALSYKDTKNAFYIGRKYCAPIAYEGALKLKEISYIHAEGYTAGELKHGPIALIDETMPSIVVCPKDSVFEKTKSNMEEIRARSGKLVAITTEGNTGIEDIANDVIYIPKSLEMLTPILATIPLQLFAYYIAVEKGNDPDKPRNLAKSVTVE